MRNLLINSFLLLLICGIRDDSQLVPTTDNSVKTALYSNGTQFDNTIVNGYALQSIRNKIKRADSSLVLIKVLHIGDSHIKAGYFSQAFMEKLNARYAKKYRGNLFFNFQLFCKIGTKFSDYSGLAELDNQLLREKPDMVIISLGSNDAFSGSSRVNFYEKVDHLVTKIKALSPEAAIL